MDPLVAQGHTGCLAGSPLAGQLGVGSRVGFPTVSGLISLEISWFQYRDQWTEFDRGAEATFHYISAEIKGDFVT